jgi:Glycosyltransferases involved in cell wall biogenesis
MIDISIIVPVYNVEGLLIQCIESILNQTFQSFELILINDGSKDKSGEICEKYAANDSRIVYVNQNNQGVSSARNNGIEVSSGKWICFIDSDDLVGVNYLSNLYNAVTTNDNVFFVSSGTDSVDSNGNFLRELMHYPDTVLEGVECLEIITKYKLMNIGPGAKLFSSDIIKTIILGLIRIFHIRKMFCLCFSIYIMWIK